MDPLSLIVGALVAAGLGLLIYTQRERLIALRRSAGQQVAQVTHRLTRSLDTRYREAVIDLANSWHLAGHLISLERVAVMPRFYVLPEPISPDRDEEVEAQHLHSPLGLVPIIPDWPQAMAPYGLESVPLQRLLRGADGVALLGLPGSGRTVALALTAILLARQREADQPGGIVSEVRLPVLAHLADVDLSPQGLGLTTDPPPAAVDPLVPLFVAARSRLGILAGQALEAVHEQLAQGQGVILLDGWDELPSSRRWQVVEWLKALQAVYPGNKLIVAGPVRGWEPLMQAGLAPVFIMPWDRPQYAELGCLWGAAWPDIGSSRRGPAPAPEADLIRRAVRGNRARSPLDATLRLWATLAGDDPGQGRRGWYSAYIDRASPAPELRPALESLAEALFADPESIGLSVEQVAKQIDDLIQGLVPPPAISTPDFLYEIKARTHLLSERAGQRLAFTHPMVQAYLVAEALRDSPLPEHLPGDSTINDEVIAFLGEVRDLTPYVEARLCERPDITRSRLLSMAKWACDAPLSAAWRGEVFKRLAQLMLTPGQYPLLRERAMAALVASRDPNVRFIFQRGLRNADPYARLLSVLGLGALGDPEVAVILGQLLESEGVEEDVQVAAALALGALNSKSALDNFMIAALLTGSQAVRRAIADMLATNTADEGYDVLREAAQEGDPLTRRAVVLGLQRVEEKDGWVVELLSQIERRDPEWLVRTTAGYVLKMLREQPQLVPHHPASPEQIAWLADWLADRDQSPAPGPQGLAQMVQALQTGSEPIRLAAAQTLGALADPDAVPALYEALRDPAPAVRDAAHRALAAISLAVGCSLPAPA